MSHAIAGTPPVVSDRTGDRMVARARTHAAAVAEPALRFALVVIFLWFGAMKFTDSEAAGIAPLILHSPLVGWLHDVLGLKGASLFIGCWELATAALLAIGAFSRRIGALGALGGVVTFLITVSFLFTTPGMFEPKGGGFPAISHTGAFLLKDVTLLGACVFLLGSSLIRERVVHAGGVIMQVGLILVFGVIGLAKFYAYEAADIAPLLLHSPLVGWLPGVAGITGSSELIGVIELLTALLLLLRPVSSQLSTLGAWMAGIALIITLSFFVTTPGVCEPLAGGCPAISIPVGQFLLKDLGLLAAAIWAFAASIRDHAINTSKVAP